MDKTARSRERRAPARPLPGTSAVSRHPTWLFLRTALDAIDGMLPRQHGQRSRLGACPNEIGDVVSDPAFRATSGCPPPLFDTVFATRVFPTGVASRILLTFAFTSAGMR
jgi:hypothetical protein